MVGAVIVKDGRIIGEGWHERYEMCIRDSFFYCVEFHILCPFSYNFEAVQLHNFLTIQPHAHSQTRTIPVPVSYTHLDVYKRQSHGRAHMDMNGL